MTNGERPDVTVIVPILNEERTVAEALESVLAVPISKQVIAVDDGSTDGTSAILDGFRDRVVVITNPARGGKGAAIRQALPFARGRVVVIQDADLEYDPADLPRLVEPILDGRYGVVYGSRFQRGFPPGMAWPNRVVNVLLIWAVRLIFGRAITDEATCYKAVRTDLIRDMELECQRFEFCPEVTAKAIRLGEPIHEVPVRYTPRSKEAGKKIRWTDAPEAFWTLWRHRNWRPPPG